MKIKNLYTAEEVGDLIGESPEAFVRMVRGGRVDIDFVKVDGEVMFEREAVEKFLKGVYSSEVSYEDSEEGDSREPATVSYKNIEPGVKSYTILKKYQKPQDFLTLEEAAEALEIFHLTLVDLAYDGQVQWVKADEEMLFMPKTIEKLRKDWNIKGDFHEILKNLRTKREDCSESQGY